MIEAIAQFAHSIRYEDMATDDIAAIKLLVIDTIGCALGAVGCTPASMIRPMLRMVDGPEEHAFLFGENAHASLESAILYNGTLVRYLDFMDVYWARDICHPSENIPVALACAQAARLDGRALVESIAVAYEVQVRLAEAFSLEGLHLHHVSAAGFIAPLLMGKLWKLSVSQMAHACALGGFRHLSHATLAQGQLSMAKAIGYAAASADCVMTTRLAARGFTGPLAVLDRMGLSAINLSRGTGSARKVSLKRFPVQYTLQSPVEAALELRRMIGDVSDILELRIEVAEDVCRRTADTAKFNPDSRETADHSLPVCVAMALLDGKLTAAQFHEDRWRDADVRNFVQRVRAEPSEGLARRWPAGRPARLAATMRDGSQHQVTIGVPLGDASRPLDPDDVNRKFMVLATPVLGVRAAQQLVLQLSSLETMEEVGSLGGLLPA